jgi:hypothetical protein
MMLRKMEINFILNVKELKKVFDVFPSAFSLCENIKLRVLTHD